MNKNLNTNIDEYSIDELRNIFEIEENDTHEIVEKFNSIFEQDFFNHDNKKMVEFLNSARDKLLDSVTSQYKYIDNDLFNYENNEINEINKNNLIESMKNINEEIEVNPDQEIESTVLLDTPIIYKSKFYEEKKYFDFNSEFKIKSSSNTYEFEFIPIQNNVKSIKLSSITFQKPDNISEVKNNNKFNILKIDNSGSITTYTITIDDGLYIGHDIINYLNEEYFYLSNNQDDFLKSIKIRKISGSEKILFECSMNSLNFSKFRLDFFSYYQTPYSLAEIIGFNKTKPFFESILQNNKQIIKSEKKINSKESDLYFIFNETATQTINEACVVVLDKNTLNEKVLVKLELSSSHSIDLKTFSYIFDINEKINNKREYSGISIQRFNVKLLDKYGNEVLLEELSFQLELVKQNYLLVNTDNLDENSILNNNI